MKPNKQIRKLQSSSLFPEVQRRVDELLKREPSALPLCLSVGDTTEPLPQSVSEALSAYASRLGTPEGYSGYGPTLGWSSLRELIANRFYKGRVDPEEITISDGAKSDIGRLQLLFGPKALIAVPDPSYPAYAQASLLHGQDLVYLPFTPQNHFQPDYTSAPKTDVIYVCSPHNPTGSVHTHSDLQQLVARAQAIGACIVFDSSYAAYIQDKSLPRTIYEIEGARRVAIEVGSFAKLAGFTGVRLGWTIVPKSLTLADGSSLLSAWTRLLLALFNGPSNIAQAGGVAVMQDEGFADCMKTVAHTMESAQILKAALLACGLTVYGGDNAPYLWVHFQGRKSWDIFQELLDRAHIVTAPGSGFGSQGESFVRITSFGYRHTIEQAAERLLRLYSRDKTPVSGRTSMV